MIQESALLATAMFRVNPRLKPGLQDFPTAAALGTEHPIQVRAYIDFYRREYIDVKFIVLDKIGQGSFGKVYKIKVQQQDLQYRPMAMKVVRSRPKDFQSNTEVAILT